MAEPTLTLPEAMKRAFAAYERGQLGEADRLARAIVSVKADYFDALHLIAVVYSRQSRFNEALESYDRALAARPDHVQALNNRGVTLKELKRFDEALASYDRALAVRADHADVLFNRGNALQELKRFDEALVSYDRALAVRPDYVEVLFSRGNTLKELRRFEEALTSYDHALAVRPGYAEALYSRGVMLQDLKRFDEALASYEQLLAIKPNHRNAFSRMAVTALRACDWSRMARLSDKIKSHVLERTSIVNPFILLGYGSDAALQLKGTQNYIGQRIPTLPPSLWDGAIWRGDKVRIAYLSADFRRHATASLIAELFELHDRSRFEVIGVSFGPDDASDMRSRLVKSFDQFHDVRFKSDRDAAMLMHDLQVDIAIDLMGSHQGARPGILAHRPAPVQVNYLGFPGTTGASFIDYVIADKIVLPLDQQPYYTEKIVHLPECYQANDTKSRIAGRKPERYQAGLPESGFVFCCFNNNYKVAAPVFDVWMRLLRAVDGSVLWLLSDNDSAEKNLRNEAAARGVDPARLVFAGMVQPEDHLARHLLADLFLDTLPINAHTVASDALWMGLPVVTCRGEAFAGRVAASLLHAVGLPELVTSSLEDYEALALKLAADAVLLQSTRQKLARNKESYPLFDTNRFRRHLEQAYTMMWDIWQRGESPRSFSVALKSDPTSH